MSRPRQQTAVPLRTQSPVYVSVTKDALHFPVTVEKREGLASQTSSIFISKGLTQTGHASSRTLSSSTSAKSGSPFYWFTNILAAAFPRCLVQGLSWGTCIFTHVRDISCRPFHDLSTWEAFLRESKQRAGASFILFFFILLLVFPFYFEHSTYFN